MTSRELYQALKSYGYVFKVVKGQAQMKHNVISPGTSMEERKRYDNYLKVLARVQESETRKALSEYVVKTYSYSQEKATEMIIGCNENQQELLRGLSSSVVLGWASVSCQYHSVLYHCYSLMDKACADGDLIALEEVCKKTETIFNKIVLEYCETHGRIDLLGTIVKDSNCPFIDKTTDDDNVVKQVEEYRQKRRALA